MTTRSVAIGVFDGVHLGHRAMLDAAAGVGDDPEVIAVTFDPHPLAVVAGDPPPLLCTVEERIALLQASGADLVEVVPFSRELAVLSAAEFHEGWLVRRLRADAVTVGDNFRFGHRAAGDVGELRRLNDASGVRTQVVPLALADGEPVSSSRIRRLLQNDGDVAGARRLLGRRFTLTGPVVLGARRGRGLGIPTANLELQPGLCIPLDGVYAAQAWVEGRGGFPAAVSIGTNPQFQQPGMPAARTVEAHLLGYGGDDFYGARCTLSFEQRMRGQAVFASVSELVEQMQADIAAVRGVLDRASQRG